MQRTCLPHTRASGSSSTLTHGLYKTPGPWPECFSARAASHSGWTPRPQPSSFCGMTGCRRPRPSVLCWYSLASASRLSHLHMLSALTPVPGAGQASKKRTHGEPGPATTAHLRPSKTTISCQCYLALPHKGPRGSTQEQLA